MKLLWNLFFLASMLFTVSCQAQMMKTLSDAPKLKEHEAEFIGKPLKKLLKEIGPEIKMVTPGANRYDAPDFLLFRFVTRKKYSAYEAEKLLPLTIRVFVKEKIDWDFKKRTKDERENFLWTKQDAEKYGNLTILGIGVYGEVSLVE